MEPPCGTSQMIEGANKTVQTLEGPFFEAYFVNLYTYIVNIL